MLNFIRHRIEQEVVNHTGLVLGNIDYTQPAGDLGLFGPDSICWQVHRDFSCMLVGGMSALLLQMLHPAALSGVWDYSSFKNDLLGRLRRTGQFIATTTFGSQQDAVNMIHRVKNIHDQIKGVTPYNQPYAANDGHLLTWVHVAEMRSFLQAYLKYKNPHLTKQQQNQYYRETATIAKALGATDIPVTVTTLMNICMNNKYTVYLIRERMKFFVFYRHRQLNISCLLFLHISHFMQVLLYFLNLPGISISHTAVQQHNFLVKKVYD